MSGDGGDVRACQGEAVRMGGRLEEGGGRDAEGEGRRAGWMMEGLGGDCLT